MLHVRARSTSAERARLPGNTKMQVQANRAAVPDDVKQLVDALVPPPRTSPPISAAAAALSPAPTVAVPPIPRPTEPKQFLDALAGKDSTDETFTFQTFDDDNTRRDGSLA